MNLDSSVIIDQYPGSRYADDSGDSKNRHAFRRQWLALKAPEDYHTLLKRFKLSPLQGLRMIGNTWANQISFEGFISRIRTLHEVQLPCTLQSQTDIGVVRSRHSGSIQHFQADQDWFELQHGELRIRVRRSRIETAWVVSKPERSGIVNALELYNAQHESMLSLQNTDDANERAIWQDIITVLPMREN